MRILVSRELPASLLGTCSTVVGESGPWLSAGRSQARSYSGGCGAGAIIPKLRAPWALWAGLLGTRADLTPELLPAIQSQVLKVLGSGRHFSCHLYKVISASVTLLPKPSLLGEVLPGPGWEAVGHPWAPVEFCSEHAQEPPVRTGVGEATVA